MSERILVVYHEFLDEPLSRTIQERAMEYGFQTYVFDGRVPGDTEKCLETAKDAEILYTFTPRVLQNASEKLKWVCCMYAGVDLFLKPSVFPNENVLFTNSNVYGAAIAEHVVMVLLMMMRRMAEYTAVINARGWERNLEIDGIVDNVFLVAGTGDLGANIARRLRGMGAARVIGVNRSGAYTGNENPFDEIHPITALKTLLPRAKGVIAAVPKIPETDLLFDEEAFQTMQEGAYFVNVGRGNAVDEAALINALNTGHLRGASLDVFMREPLPKDDPLYDAKNLLITPHISGNTCLPYTRQENVASFLDDLNRYIKGEPLRRLVDRKKGY